MEKIEYGDINKFLVSTGIVFITLSALIPYFYLKEDFGIYLSSADISKLEAPVRTLILDKQSKVIFIQQIIPWISLAFLTIGLIAVIIGLVRWSRRQQKIDEKFDKEILKLDLEIESLTPEERIEKAKNEAREIELAEQIANQVAEIQTGRPNNTHLEYLEIERTIYKMFNDVKSKNFDILTDQKLGNRFYIDAIFKATNTKFADRIVEIKYFKKHLSMNILAQSVHQLNTYATYYKTNSYKNVVPVLLVVYNSNLISLENVEKAKSEIMEFAVSLPNLKRLKVEFIDKDKVQFFQPIKLFSK